jgi:hypothetical protein
LDILIKEIIQSDLAVTSIKGEMVFKIIKDNIEKDEVSVLNFEGIKTLTTAFLNVAIGQLYDVNTPEELRRLVKINPNVNESHLKKITLVLSNSKEKRENTKKSLQEVLNGD